MYITYTPNLGLRVTIFDQEREQGRFRGSNEGAPGEHKESLWGNVGAQQVGAQNTSLIESLKLLIFFAIHATPSDTREQERSTSFSIHSSRLLYTYSEMASW